MRLLASRKIPIKFFIIEGLISIKAELSTLPEHSRKPFSGDFRHFQTLIFRQKLQKTLLAKVAFINFKLLAIEAFVSHCRKLIQTGPILLSQIERVHSEAISLSETIQSLGSGKFKSILTEIRISQIHLLGHIRSMFHSLLEIISWKFKH